MSTDGPARSGRERAKQWQDSLQESDGRGYDANTAELTDGAPSGGMDGRHLPRGRGREGQQGPSEPDVSSTPG